MISELEIPKKFISRKTVLASNDSMKDYYGLNNASADNNIVRTIQNNKSMNRRSFEDDTSYTPIYRINQRKTLPQVSSFLKRRSTFIDPDSSATFKYKKNIEENSSIFSKMTLGWTIQILLAGKRAYNNNRNLKEGDLYDCMEEEAPDFAYIHMRDNFTPKMQELSEDYLQQKVDLIKKSVSCKQNKTNNLEEIRKQEKYLENMKKTIDKMLYTTLKLMNKRDYIISTLLGIIANLCQFAGPIFLKYIVKFIKDTNQDEWQGYFFASMIFLAYFIRVFLMQHSLQITNRVALKVQNSLITSIFDKVLRLSSSAKKFYDSGKTVTLVTVDSASVFGYVMMAQNIIISPIMVIVSVAFIISELGVIGLVTPVLFLLGAYLQKYVNSGAFQLRRIILTWTDKRSKQLNEFFESIRVIKFYGWEDMISRRIFTIRNVETQNLLKNQIIKTIVEVIMNSTPLVISIIIFGLYAGIYGDIDTAKAYSVLSLLNLLLNPLKMIVIVLLLQQNATTSLARIGEFLMAEEKQYEIEENIEENLNNPSEKFENGTIVIEEGDFSWESLKSTVHNHFNKNQKKNPNDEKQPDQKKPLIQQSEFKRPENVAATADTTFRTKDIKVIPFDDEQQKTQISYHLTEIEQITQRDYRILKNINLVIQPSEVVAVVGQVASGKSSLLMAILGEMIKLKGNVKVQGSIAYVPQQAWLINSTVRENILFGLPFSQNKYDRIIEKCQLREDLQNKEVFPLGDKTEIGERGSNLSGGQKQRIGIARAVYAEADIYLIDDCLSALDAAVGKMIFYEIILEELEGKTIIFITHALHFIEDIEKIVVLKEGEIIDQGNHSKLSKSCDEYQKLTQQKQDSDVNSDSSSSSDDDHFHEIIQDHHEQEIQIEKLQSQYGEELQQRNKVERRQKKFIGKNQKGLEKNDEQMKEEESLIKEKRLTKKLTKKQSRIIRSMRKSITMIAANQKKESEDNGIPLSIYWRYIKAGGIFATMTMVMNFILAQGLKVISDWWIGQWSDNSFKQTNLFYIIGFGILGLAQSVFIYLRGYSFGLFTINSSSSFQKQLITKLLHTPQWWYDITPIGKIIARTSKDQDDLDSTLPWNMKFALTNVFQLFTVIVTIGIIFPYFFILGFIAFMSYFFVVRFYMITARQIKKLEAQARAPVISNFQETASGIVVIRVFQKQKMFVEKMLKQQRDHLVTILNQNYCTRWVSVISDLMGMVIVSCCAYFAVLTRKYNLISNVSLVGLALSSSFQIASIISQTLKLLADTEANMNALMRIIELADKNPEENSWYEKKAPKNWPNQGQMEFKNVSLRYRSDLKLIVSNLSFSIDTHQKIGVVGRTGCGKSTLTLGILRILELASDNNKEEGQIILDGEDIRKIGLHQLRKKVTIIPQDPILFSGTLRSNIDPFNQYNDNEIIEILHKVSIWNQLEKILQKQKEKNDVNLIASQKTIEQENNKQKLNLVVEAGGVNFSLGQRQLICIARALIKKPKILLMDEATASIDEMTDTLIQNLIQQELHETTVITIAHRLKTIIQYDKILVLDQGKIKEFDSPYNLLTYGESYFRGLIIENGLIFFEEMRELAEKKMLQNKSGDLQFSQVRISPNAESDFLNTLSKQTPKHFEEKNIYQARSQSIIQLPFENSKIIEQEQAKGKD